MKKLHCPWTLIVDTREQTPWTFENLLTGPVGDRKKIVINQERGTLKQGDYSISGMQDRVAIERKSKVDLFGTVGRGRERFVRELSRLNQLEFAAVIVDSDWGDCMWHPPERSKVSPSAINGSIVAWQQRFPGIHWWFLPGPYIASKQAWKILERFWSDHNGGAKGE